MGIGPNYVGNFHGDVPHPVKLTISRTVGGVSTVLVSYLAANATNAPVTVSVDNLLITAP